MAKIYAYLSSEITLFQIHHIDAFAADNYAFSLQLLKIYVVNNSFKEMYIFKRKFTKKAMDLIHYEMFFFDVLFIEFSNAFLSYKWQCLCYSVYARFSFLAGMSYGCEWGLGTTFFSDLVVIS